MIHTITDNGNRDRHAIINEHALYMLGGDGDELQALVKCLHVFEGKAGFFPGIVMQAIDPSRHVGNARRIHVAGYDIGLIWLLPNRPLVKAVQVRISAKEIGLRFKIARALRRPERDSLAIGLKRTRKLPVHQGKAIAAVKGAFDPPLQWFCEFCGSMHGLSCPAMLRHDLGGRQQVALAWVSEGGSKVCDGRNEALLELVIALTTVLPGQLALTGTRPSSEGCERPPCAFLPGKALGLFGALLDQTCPKLFVSQYRCQFLADILNRPGVKQGIRIADDFGEAGGICANDGQSTLEGFQAGQSESFMEGRKCKDLGQIIQLHQIVVADIAQEDQLI